MTHIEINVLELNLCRIAINRSSEKVNSQLQMIDAITNQ